MSEDPLSAARGIVFGAIAGAVLWAIIIWGVIR
jgi:hypothetical protein